MKNQNSTDYKKFGLMIGSVFIGLFGLILPFVRSENIPIWPWAAGITLWIIALALPSLLKPIYIIWLKIGHILGWINNRIILSLIFLLIFCQVSFYMKMIKRDVLKRRYDPGQKTYLNIRSEMSSKKMEVPY